MINQAGDYPLHKLGWKAFQDICIAISEEILKRPVQSFLPTNDAGRDGAFIGKWEGNDSSAGSSTIQCKFTAKYDLKLSLSHLADELEKAALLAKKGLAADYIIMTNHAVTGTSEQKIKEAFESVGVGNCRVFHRDWIIDRIRTSPRLRMLAPRLYGMGDLSDLLDARAYKQAQLILSEMGENLKKLVVTDAHRRSVRAIDEHRLVLLLGAPAAGKSTIGASLAVGAADTWQAYTIKATSPQQLHDRISPDEPQFFWIDDAWGSTQYQREKTEAWNEVFPLMQAAMMRGTRFLITSRDYIWKRAKTELKLQSIPALQKSQVVINVHDFTIDEKARILYNHLKFGSQEKDFIEKVKAFLPELAELKEFLPESARRLGDAFFTNNLLVYKQQLVSFFEEPEEFLLETIEQLAADCRAAIALIFMNGGVVRSPVPQELLIQAATAYGAEPAQVREQLNAMNGSLLLFANDEQGPYWTYKHPTIGDAFARYVSRDPEQVEIYLRGAKVESIAMEVVCSGATLAGAPVIVPDSLHEILAKRLEMLANYSLVNFLSYRSNKKFNKLIMNLRPDILEGMSYFHRPVSEDSDAQLLAALYKQELLPEEIRKNFFEQVKKAAIEDFDASFLDMNLRGVLTQEEIEDILKLMKSDMVEQLPSQIRKLKEEWHGEYTPSEHFDVLRENIRKVATEIKLDNLNKFLSEVEVEIQFVVDEMEIEYSPPSLPSSKAATQFSKTGIGSLSELFRDVDK